MPAQLSEDLKKRIVKWYFEDGLTYRDIRDQGNVSLGLISNTIRNYCAFHEVNNSFQRCTGWPSYLNNEDMAFIESTLIANPSIYLDELQKRLYDTRNLEQSQPSLVHLHQPNILGNGLQKHPPKGMRSCAVCGRSQWQNTLIRLSLFFLTKAPSITKPSNDLMDGPDLANPAYAV